MKSPTSPATPHAKPQIKPQIVFFGTGPVSLGCLEGIYDRFEIEAIITKPDRVAPSGTVHEHPVRQWAAAQAVAVHQVADKAALAALFGRERFASRVGLVVDFGLLIPDSVIDSFELGIINSHFSLLPLLRGADPITFAILEGHTETGVSLMKIEAAMDEGDLIAQERLRLRPDVTTPELTRELGDLSNNLLRHLLEKYITHDITPWPQDVKTVKPSYTRRLTKTDGAVDWRKPAAVLEREVRAFVGWPGSRTRLFGREVTLTAVRVVAQAEAAAAADSGTVGSDAAASHLDFRKFGTVLRGWPERLFVVCGDNGDGDSVLEIMQLKPAGKREMAVADFLRGQRP